MNWEAALDEIERSSEEWQPPTDLGPLPTHLVGRAQEVLAGLERRIGATEREQGELREELGRLTRRPHPRGDVAPTRFDHRV